MIDVGERRWSRFSHGTLANSGVTAMRARNNWYGVSCRICCRGVINSQLGDGTLALQCSIQLDSLISASNESVAATKFPNLASPACSSRHHTLACSLFRCGPRISMNPSFESTALVPEIQAMKIKQNTWERMTVHLVTPMEQLQVRILVETPELSTPPNPNSPTLASWVARLKILELFALHSIGVYGYTNQATSMLKELLLFFKVSNSNTKNVKDVNI
ncbi:hypothetical protein F3Y22_tig00110481pilonHSYRG00068 [Hibiscus syriacus]|uniref:Uncharacterized protein n=1 Tax=Hibiscus syriacus TaxID=106335 RepID=A0A6A3AGE0_HIBSY|nr:hypothetical protein F3Y22_tig00110481pilonHSYRG00068 [Hibiscus syriacus]